MFSAGPEERPFSTGGYAPWPNKSRPAVTARTILCIVASILFCAVLIVACSAVEFLLSKPSAASRLSAAYRQMQPAVVCSVTSMECVEMAIYGTACARRVSDVREPERTGPALKFIDADDPLHVNNVRKALLAGADLSEPQMFAMMNMSADHRQQAIWHYARQNIFEIPPFTFGTFTELRERGLAEKPEGSKYHRLTLSAAPLAGAVADELVRRYKIHAPILVHLRGEISKTATFRCACGYSCALTAGDNMQLKAGRAFSSHLRGVNTVDYIAKSIEAGTRKQSEG
jgi:hypothetical protein